MATACIAHSALRVHGISKPIIARFDQPQASSDGGAILLKAVDDRLGLTWRLACAIRDRRQPGKVAHPLRDLLRQRVFGLACGYADCNDAARLVDDPIHKLLLDRDPLDGAGLGSQPTLSRFENAVGRADLYRLGTALADAVLTYHRERLGDGVRLITIDLDATDDPTHGQQEFALFTSYYDTSCYLPLLATVTFNTEPIQHVVAALLRPGTGAATRGVRGLLRRLFSTLRTLFPALEWQHLPCLSPDRGGTSVLAQQPGDRRDQIGRFEGLGDVHLEPGRQGSRPIFGPSVGGHGQGRNGPPALGFQGSKLLDQRVSVDIRQSDVADQDVWVPLLHLLECLLGARG